MIGTILARRYCLCLLARLNVATHQGISQTDPSAKPTNDELTVVSQFIVDAATERSQLDSLLVSALPREFPSRASAQRALRRGNILVDGKPAVDVVTRGQTVQYVSGARRIHLAGASAVEPALLLECLHADEWLAALIKPPGYAVQERTNLCLFGASPHQSIGLAPSYRVAPRALSVSGLPSSGLSCHVLLRFGSSCPVLKMSPHPSVPIPYHSVASSCRFFAPRPTAPRLWMMPQFIRIALCHSPHRITPHHTRPHQPSSANAVASSCPPVRHCGVSLAPTQNAPPYPLPPPPPTTPPPSTTFFSSVSPCPPPITFPPPHPPLSTSPGRRKRPSAQTSS